MSAFRLLLAASLCLFATIDRVRAAEPTPAISALARMPVKEVTVFKDGHAFVLHKGTMPTNNGSVVMDYLPAPVLGTFFPYCVQKGAKLASVVAGARRVSIPRTSLSMKELIEGNPGADVHVEEVSGANALNQKIISYDATIIGIPTRSSEELDETSPPNSDEQLPQKSNMVLLKTAGGTSVVSLDHIQSISFKNGFKEKLSNEEFRNLLNLKLKWDGPAKNTAEVGMVYLQKGLRWIPSYKVNLHTDGTADVKLQATLINELVDLDDVNCNLVIGVPTFAFADNTDPISIQQIAANLSPHFRGGQTAHAFSNSIMSQAPMLQGATNGTIGPSFGDAFVSGADQPEVNGGSKSEDLFIFTANHITLKKGQRMVVPISEYTMKYKDVYTLTMPFSPPSEVHMNYTPNKREMERAFNAPKVMHNIRLLNKTSQPLTTAPVLILKDNKLIAQGTSTYTAPNSSCDVPLTAAIDVKVTKSDRETKRTNDAARIDDNSYSRVDLEGNIELTNFSQKPMEVEVKRFVLGKMSSVDHAGKIEMINIFEDSDMATDPSSSALWWHWYSWPHWWNTVNGMGKSTWNVTLSPMEPLKLTYKWNYLWR